MAPVAACGARRPGEPSTLRPIVISVSSWPGGLDSPGAGRELGDRGREPVLDREATGASRKARRPIVRRFTVPKNTDNHRGYEQHTWLGFAWRLNGRLAAARPRANPKVS